MTDNAPPFQLDLLAFGEETDREAGIWVCQIEVDAGHAALYVPGLSKKDRFFSASQYGPDNTHDAAQAAHPGADIKKVTRLTMFADTVLNRNETPSWKHNEWIHDIVNWHAAYKEILAPSLAPAIEKGLRAQQRGWAAIGLEKDPYVKKDGSQDNVPYIIEYFGDDANAAAEYAEANRVESGPPDPFDIPPQPEEWDSEMYGSYREYAFELGRSFISNPNLKAKEQALPDAGLTVELVKQIRDSALDSDANLPF